jgi:hypothetical protein
MAETAWTFGWNALVAVGTLALAAVTALLALSTRRLARDTARLAEETADEIASSIRPLLVPVAETARTYIVEDPHGLTLRMTVRNGGSGPAAFVRAFHDPSETSPENWSLGSLARGESVELVFRVLSYTPTSQVLLDYRDLAGRTYSTAIVLETPQPPTDKSRARTPARRYRKLGGGCG